MRIAPCFERLSSQGRKALVPYIVAGDPPNDTVSIMHRLVASGASLIELGIPFSDPVADGPVIARAHEQSLAGGMTLLGVLELVARFREDDNVTPIVLMGYLNPIETMGCETFAQRASEAGVDGVLVVDLPTEYAGELDGCLRTGQIDRIQLVTPTTSDERVRQICARASGFLYYVSLKGVTGSATLDVDDVRQRVEQIRECAKLPVCVGFGIRNGEQAAAIAAAADGVVVGSVLVSELADHTAVEQGMDRLAQLLGSMRDAMDRGESA